VFEAPGRVGRTLRDLAAACGDERPAAIARELTKVHEQVVRGTLGELAAAVAAGTVPARGEFVLVVGMGDGRGGEHEDAHAAEAKALAAVDRLVGDGVARGEAARRVAAETGVPRRRLYRPTDV
jgi:16S rRNA (cytidine1402-2'-O)-methyltransferase